MSPLNNRPVNRTIIEPTGVKMPVHPECGPTSLSTLAVARDFVCMASHGVSLELPNFRTN